MSRYKVSCYKVIASYGYSVTILERARRGTITVQTGDCTGPERSTS